MARKTLIQVRRDTAANWTSANPTLAAGEPGFETDTGKVKFGDGSTAWTSLAYVVTDAKLVTSDITTNDVSTSKHGFVPKAPNDTAKFLRGDGTWATIGGTGTALVASDPIWDAKGDIAGATGADAAARLAVGSNGKLLVAASGETTGLKWDTGYLGGLELVYKYTVTGSDKASIDTGSDTANAGTNDWTNGDVLEIWVYGRTDEAVIPSSVVITLNNDTSASYDYSWIQALNTTVSASSPALAQTAISPFMVGASALANSFSSLSIVIPNYTGTVGYKQGDMRVPVMNSAAASFRMTKAECQYRSTSAITRLKVACPGSVKLKVGSQLLIYKRRNA